MDKKLFIYLADSRHHGKYKYNKVDLNKKFVKIKCIKHNHTFKEEPNTHLMGKVSGCPLCIEDRRKARVKKERPPTYEVGFNPNSPAEFYIYIISEKLLGYGITGSGDSRHYAHCRNLKKAGYSFKHTYTFKFKSGFTARKLENFVLDNYASINIGVSGFKRECCSIDHLDEILAEAERIIDEKRTTDSN